MNLREDIRSVSYVKAHTADMMKQVNNTHRPVFVTQNGEAKAVLMDSESYEKIIKAVGLFKLFAQGEKDILEGKYIEQNKAFEEVEELLNSVEETHA
jgi:prevent-host-death family protein